MKHVFVETNFIVDVARPFPSPDAEALLKRAQPGGDVALHLPWVAVAEAKPRLGGAVWSLHPPGSVLMGRLERA